MSTEEKAPVDYRMLPAAERIDPRHPKEKYNWHYNYPAPGFTCPEYYFAAPPRLENLAADPEIIDRFKSKIGTMGFVAASAIITKVGLEFLWQAPWNIPSRPRSKVFWMKGLVNAWPVLVFPAAYIFYKLQEAPLGWKQDERDAVMEEYMKLHPDRFPVYKPQKKIETFEPWYPAFKRSGGSWKKSEWDSWGKTKHTDQYDPKPDMRWPEM